MFTSRTQFDRPNKEEEIAPFQPPSDKCKIMDRCYESSGSRFSSLRFSPPCGMETRYMKLLSGSSAISAAAAAASSKSYVTEGNVHTRCLRLKPPVREVAEKKAKETLKKFPPSSCSWWSPPPAVPSPNETDRVASVVPWFCDFIPTMAVTSKWQ
ncbi:hypothetical protein M0802_009453 [Mischocyttarus mexicanus]|nr:hypothetical protein M0802_009453 [Mischocyttarus mexicanus]